MYQSYPKNLTGTSSFNLYIYKQPKGFLIIYLFFCLRWVVFPWGSAGIESTCNVGDLGSIPGLGRSPGEGKDCPLQYSGLENSMDCIFHGVAKSQTRLSIFVAAHGLSLVAAVRATLYS